MYGAIIGDIVGSIYEFDNIRTKEFPLFSHNCYFTDDTVMSEAEAFYGIDDKLKAQAKSYLDEFLSSMVEGFEEAFIKY